MLKDGRWQTWKNYATYEDAEEDACGLITSGHATQVHIPEIGNNGGRIVALISSTPKAGWPHGQAVVKKLPQTN